MPWDAIIASFSAQFAPYLGAGGAVFIIASLSLARYFGVIGKEVKADREQNNRDRAEYILALQAEVRRLTETGREDRKEAAHNEAELEAEVKDLRLRLREMAKDRDAGWDKLRAMTSFAHDMRHDAHNKMHVFYAAGKAGAEMPGYRLAPVPAMHAIEGKTADDLGSDAY